MIYCQRDLYIKSSGLSVVHPVTVACAGQWKELQLTYSATQASYKEQKVLQPMYRVRIALYSLADICSIIRSPSSRTQLY